MFFKESLQELYLEDKRPWLVGFSGGKDSTMLASLIFDADRSIPTEDVGSYLLQNPNLWGGDNRPLYKLYASASDGECTIHQHSQLWQQPLRLLDVHRGWPRQGQRFIIELVQHGGVKWCRAKGAVSDGINSTQSA
jgi:DNA sulfur modification protein DndC